MILVILPHQLFEKKHLKKIPNIDTIIVWEHPHYFKTYKYNKKKLLLHRLSMKNYYDYLSSSYKCKYVDFNEKFNYKDYTIFDPVDKITLPGKPIMIESPAFLLSKTMYAEYRKKTDKFHFNSFYMWGKRCLDVLPKLKSLDKMNREKMPANVSIPKLPTLKISRNKHFKPSQQYVEKYFSKNIGNTDDFMYPITHKDANKFLKNFIDEKLKNFGPYQDAIGCEESILFHSVLSSSMNIGIITPLEVMTVVAKKKQPLNSVEGFIRQLFWREYQRYCYIYCSFQGNYLGNRKKLSSAWYNGTIGVVPVDNCIVRGIESGYLNHIERLMVVGNYMNLWGLHPLEGYRWFMEFSIDSYDWVMHQNVLDMVFFVTGGATMRRPYVSSSNYILRMSNYSRGDWCDIWDDAYRKFVKSKKKKLYKFRYYFKF